MKTGWAFEVYTKMMCHFEVFIYFHQDNTAVTDDKYGDPS